MTLVTQAEIAKVAGVSSYTVSCALRGEVQVAAATRERIVKLAAAMGYQPNAAAAALAGRRHHGRRGARQLRLGWFGFENDREWMEGFSRGCAELGYDSERIEYQRYASAAAMGRAVWHSGVDGLILHPGFAAIPHSTWDGFDWSRFSVVKISRVLPTLKFHLIRHSAFDYAARALREVFARGYCRLAVLLVESESPEDDDARLGAVLNFQATRLPEGATLEWRRRELPRNSLSMRAESQWQAGWLESMQADALLAFPWAWISLLAQVGRRFPDDLGCASIIAPEAGATTLEIAGCDRSALEMARRAVHELHRLVVRGERGFAEQPMEHVVEPVWLEGKTLPPK